MLQDGKHPRALLGPNGKTALMDANIRCFLDFRKTGVTLKDTGVRDEHGMQPLEDIFSSPEKESQNGVDEDDSEDEPMDIDESELESSSRAASTR